MIARLGAESKHLFTSKLTNQIGRICKNSITITIMSEIIVYLNYVEVIPKYLGDY